MQIPKQVDYGVRALVDLAINHKSGLARTSDIAKRQNIPEPYLAQVLLSLQRNGLTEAQRGPLGGHSLKMDPSLITMGMVMRYLDGTQTLIGCLDDTSACCHSAQCGQRNIWRNVEQAIWQVLDSTSISDLTEESKPSKNNIAQNS